MVEVAEATDASAGEECSEGTMRESETEVKEGVG